MFKPEIEKALLGCLINGPHKLAEAEAAGGAKLFYTTEHQSIFAGIRLQVASGDTVDALTVSGRANIPLYKVLECATAGPAPDMADSYINQLKELVVSRELKVICQQTLGRVEVDLPEELLTDINQRVHDLSLYTVKPKGGTADELVEQAWNYYIENEGQPPDFLKTGFVDLDLILDGLQPSEHIILAARPSVGKSALAMDVAREVAKEDKRVLFFSMEMTPERLVQRMLCAEALVSLKRLRNNQLKGDEKAKVQRVLTKVMEYARRITLVPGQIGVNDVKARVLQEQHKNGVDLVVIDYLQLMKTGGDGSTNDKVGRNARGLQLVSKEINIPVITLSQLSRESEKQQRRPLVTDLRDSGEIEQAGDKIVLMYKETREDLEVELIVGKSKDGPTGTVKVGWMPEAVTFRSKAKITEPPQVMAGGRQWEGN